MSEKAAAKILPRRHTDSKRMHIVKDVPISLGKSWVNKRLLAVEPRETLG